MKTASALVVVAGLACAASAQTAVLNIPADTPTWDGPGSTNNVVLTFDVASLMGFAPGTPVTLQSLSWDVNIETLGESWLREARMLFRTSANAQLFSFAPTGTGPAAQVPSVGIENFVGGPIALTGALPPASLFLPDGIVKVEFFETFDDAANEIDAFYRSGSVTFTGIPTPGAAALLGLGALAAGRRRR
jgi:MYXO-CTERM domain-containing protein